MDFKDFLDEYLGMIIGILIAILICIFGWIKPFVYIALIVFGGWLGRYIQKNKDKVKDDLKNMIDRF